MAGVVCPDTLEVLDPSKAEEASGWTAPCPTMAGVVCPDTREVLDPNKVEDPVRRVVHTAHHWAMPQKALWSLEQHPVVSSARLMFPPVRKPRQAVQLDCGKPPAGHAIGSVQLALCLAALLSWHVCGAANTGACPPGFLKGSALPEPARPELEASLEIALASSQQCLKHLGVAAVGLQDR